MPDNKITVINPEEFFSSPVEYSTLTHEVEHAIQKFSLKDMGAEGNYINSLPKSVRDQIIAEASEFHLKPQVKQLLIRRFNNGELSSSE